MPFLRRTLRKEKHVSSGRIKAGAIRVQYGFHKSEHEGFGWVHVEKHTKDILNAGYEGQNEFLLDVLRNFDEIWIQSNGKFALVKFEQVNTKFKKLAVVRLDSHDGFYGVTTAYPEKSPKDLTAKGIKIWP